MIDIPEPVPRTCQLDVTVDGSTSTVTGRQSLVAWAPSEGKVLLEYGLVTHGSVNLSGALSLVVAAWPEAQIAVESDRGGIRGVGAPPSEGPSADEPVVGGSLSIDEGCQVRADLVLRSGAHVTAAGCGVATCSLSRQSGYTVGNDGTKTPIFGPEPDPQWQSAFCGQLALRWPQCVPKQ